VWAFAAGLGSISTVPDGYYLPLTLAAVMVGSYGGSYALGLQRVICTLLGGLLLLIAQPALTSLPFPIGLALMLGVIRLLGGCLGLQAGYKITGMVVVMGWLMQPTAVDMLAGPEIELDAAWGCSRPIGAASVLAEHGDSRASACVRGLVRATA